MGKLEKAIKIHMFFGILFIIPYGLPSTLQYYTVFFGFTLYPPINIVYWTWRLWLCYGYAQMSQIWVWYYFTPLVIIAMEGLEWYALRVLKKRKRTLQKQ